MSHIIPEQLKKVYFAGNGKEIEVFSPDHKRTFCYVSDAVEMIYRLAISEGSLNQSYNIGNEGPEVEIRDVVKTIVKIVGNDVKLKEMPATEGSPSRRCPSMKKTEEVIGYKGCVSLEKGIQKTFEWYKANVFSDNVESAK